MGDIATDRAVYGRVFVVAVVELGMTLATPVTALLQAWAGVAPPVTPLI